MAVARPLRLINAGIFSTCFVGIVLSYYAYVVETSKEEDESYEAMCDISEHISCTKAFSSGSGKGFGIIPKDSLIYLPNSVYGIVFYSTIAAISILNSYLSTVTLMALIVFSNLGSVYLANILYTLRTVCVVCVGTYIVNAINLWLVLKKLRIVSRGSSPKRKTK